MNTEKANYSSKESKCTFGQSNIQSHKRNQNLARRQKKKNLRAFWIWFCKKTPKWGKNCIYSKNGLPFGFQYIQADFPSIILYIGVRNMIQKSDFWGLHGITIRKLKSNMKKSQHQKVRRSVQLWNDFWHLLLEICFCEFSFWKWIFWFVPQKWFFGACFFENDL